MEECKADSNAVTSGGVTSETNQGKHFGLWLDGEIHTGRENSETHWNMTFDTYGVYVTKKSANIKSVKNYERIRKGRLSNAQRLTSKPARRKRNVNEEKMSASSRHYHCLRQNLFGNPLKSRGVRRQRVHRLLR